MDFLKGILHGDLDPYQYVATFKNYFPWLSSKNIYYVQASYIPAISTSYPQNSGFFYCYQYLKSYVQVDSYLG